MAKMSESAVPSLLFTETANASIATPAAGKASLFRDTDNTWKDKDEAGTVTAIGTGASTDGWTSAGETWTYVSADGPTGVFSVAADVTTKYSVGMRVRYTQTTVKYGIVTAVGAFGAGVTPITIYGGTDYTTANAAISANSYAVAKTPFGFPVDPAKWTQTFSDATDTSQGSPVSGTWYNIGTSTLSIPIGAWRVQYAVVLSVARAASGGMSVHPTLSTANNSESDVSMSSMVYVTVGTQVLQFISRERFLLLAAKTSYFLNAKTTDASMTTISFNGTKGTTQIRAICAYL